MKTAQKQFLSNLNASKTERLSQFSNESLSIDRRRFLQYAAGVGAMATLGGSAFAQAQNAAAAGAASTPVPSDLRLPDGTAYVPWEMPLTFSKTYYVDNNSARADDNGPGTTERPFRTINKAAQLLQPGERVVIASGTYRECVRPARGGTSPTQMISYEAAPGAKVFIKGSEVVKNGWEQDPVLAGRGGPPGGPAGAAARPAAPPPVPTWQYKFTGAMFPDMYNPFALASVAGDRAWLDTKAVDMGPYFRRRGLVFVDGKPLEPVEQQRELGAPKLYTPPPPGTPQPPNGLPPRARGGPILQEVGGTEDGRFYTENDGTAIHVRMPSGTPADHMIEITTRDQVFAPTQRGLGYIRLKGLTLSQGANVFPLPQRGMVSTSGGNHWIFEGNTIEWANAIGVEMGGGGVGHVIRGNTFRYCGVCGVAGIGSTDVLVEDNLIEWCGWADVEREWESAGAKFHRARNMMFRRNVIRHIRHGNAVWFDSGNVNCRLTGNIFADILTVGAAVHMEVNLAQDQIDNNIIWDVRNAEPGTPGQRGCAGSGIFINATDKQVIVQNLIGRCDNAGIWAITRPDRAGTGTATDNTISNNIFARCDKAGIVFLSTQNKADGNLYSSMPNEFQGFFTGDSKQWLTLANWRDTHGWDKDGAIANIQVDFNPDTLELTMSNPQPYPKVAAVNQVTNDLFGAATGATRAPGPLADPGAKRVWHVDPRPAAWQKSTAS